MEPTGECFQDAKLTCRAQCHLQRGAAQQGHNLSLEQLQACPKPWPWVSAAPPGRPWGLPLLSSPGPGSQTPTSVQLQEVLEGREEKLLSAHCSWHIPTGDTKPGDALGGTAGIRKGFVLSSVSERVCNQM